MNLATLQIDPAFENVYVKMPQADMGFFQHFADKMGWSVENKLDLLDRYIASRPKNVDLTDEEIMEEVRAVRYAK
jgi:hypothetical protein